MNLDMTPRSFKLHKPPLLTDESIGEEYENSVNSDVIKIISKIQKDGKDFFAGYDDGYFYTFDKYGNSFNNRLLSKNGWKLTKEVEK